MTTLTDIACPFCSKAFTSRDEAIIHGVNVHPGKPVAAELDVKYPDPQDAIITQIEHNKKIAEAANWERELEHVKFGDAKRGLTDAEKRGYLVDTIMSQLVLKTIEDTQEILYYHQGIYRQNAEAKILSLLQVIGKYEITNAMRKEVLATIKAKTFVARREFDKDVNIANLRNGLLNVVTREFQSHSPDYLSTVQLPVSFDPKARCPAIVKFFKETLEPEHVKTLVLLLGYSLYRSAKYEKAFMLVGEGSNGKSTLIRLIVALVGRDNASNVTLQELATDRFATSDLYGKMVNCFADLKTGKVIDSGGFKVVVSGDRIRAQRKHQQPFEFESYAKLIFSANQIPETNDKSYAYFRRWVILPFNRTFEGEDKDEHLIEKLTTDEELSGLLNIAIAGLATLQREGGFFDSDVAEIQDQYALGASKIRDFVTETCDMNPVNPDLCLPSRMLQEAFRKYCSERGSNYIDSRKFGEELKALGVSHKQKRVRGRKEYYYFGIALKAQDRQETLSV